MLSLKEIILWHLGAIVILNLLIWLIPANVGRIEYAEEDDEEEDEFYEEDEDDEEDGDYDEFEDDEDKNNFNIFSFISKYLSSF